MVIPAPSVDIEFTMMQKLFAYWVKKKHFYGNWSGTGVGKTYSFILASRVIDAHLTIVIGTNSTTNQLAVEVKNLYNDSVAVVYDGKLPDFDMRRHNYLIFNYEKGQQKYSQELFDAVLEKYKVDYIVFDEVQLVKQREKKCSARRRTFQTFRNNAVERYNSYVSVLTATPYVNSISEVISILSLMTGKDYHNHSTRNNPRNALMIELEVNGIGINATTEAKNINGKVIEQNIHLDEIIGDDITFNTFKNSLGTGSPLSVYQSTLQEKLEYIKVCEKIRKGELTIVYTQFTDGIVETTKKFFTKKGFRVCEYTGNNKDTEKYTENNKVNWESVKENYDIILASKPIAVGVDGLQKVCNKMVILSLPWTDADYKQLIGRILRKLSAFDKVDICIPVVRFAQLNNVGYDDKVWESIMNKGLYSNACLHGEFPTEMKSVHQSIVKDLVKELGEVRNEMVAAA